MERFVQKSVIKNKYRKNGKIEKKRLEDGS